MRPRRASRLSGLRYLLWIGLPLALAWAMRNVTVRQVLESLRQLTWYEAAALVVVNVLVVLAFSGRWWTLLRARGQHLPYLALSAYRLAAFAVSYFTPGTQFGGEPLQVHLVHRRHGVPLPAATASVVLDKVIEWIANFAFLAIGLAVVVRLGLEPAGSTLLLRIAALSLAIAPVLYLVAARRGRRPATWAVTRLRWDRLEGGVRARVTRWVETSEQEIVAATRASTAGLAGAAICSAVSWAVLLVEWGLAMKFLGIDLTASQMLAVVTAARLALFVPLPGAAGALEASLVLALSRLGVGSAQALSLAVVIRLRDVAFGAVGLWLGGWLSGRTGGEPRAAESGVLPTSEPPRSARPAGER